MQVTWFHQALSMLGAALILAAYLAHQMHWMDARATLYNLLNAVGAAMLAYVAWQPFQAGFVVLESTWAAISLAALVKALRARGGATAAAGQRP